jgi:DNA-binding SARP family transcriptional activator
VGGRPVDLRAAKPKARAALRLLAAHAGRPVHVEILVDHLWSDVDPAAGKRSLQVALSSLRRLLDDHEPGAGALIERRDDAYLLAAPEGDVVAFAVASAEARGAARREDPGAVVEAGTRALEAYAGELLPEDGPADRIVELRTALAQEAAEVATLVAQAALAEGRADVVVTACTRGLEADRYSDALWRLLTTGHERSGDLAAAARAQARYRALLADLGLTPTARP